MEELNKKLAEWAGFKQIGTLKKGYHLLIGGQKEIDWFTPEGYRHYGITPNSAGCLPNFTDSLDACFKWLVPKLTYWTLTNDECFFGIVKAVVRTQTGKIEKHMGWVYGKAEAETPALALCKTVEKLIDGEKE